MIIGKAREYQMKIYMAFIDFKKAFDLVNHTFLIESLVSQGVDGNIVQVIKNWYEGSMARVVMDKTGPDFFVNRGVKQGDPLSPILFNCVLQEVFRKLEWESKGIRINGTFLSNLRFADDVVLFSESQEELSRMVQELNEKGKGAGLRISEEKTHLMTNNENAGDIYLEGTKLKWVDSVIYLGQLITFKDGTIKEVNRRIAIAWKKFWSLKFVFKSNMSIRQKSRVFEACIVPCLLYGAQVWAMTRRAKERLRSTQCSMERSMLGVNRCQRIKNSEIRKKTRTTDVVKAALVLKWNWAGHVARMREENWARRATEWYPMDNTRKRGRQYLRWDDEIRKFSGVLWRRAGQNKCGWNKQGEAFALRWA